VACVDVIPGLVENSPVLGALGAQAPRQGATWSPKPAWTEGGQNTVKVVDIMVKSANGAMMVLLRSPLHGLVSKHAMLITVSGRKSGRLYTTPVNYVRDGDTITVVSRPNRTWWRNLRGGAPVAVRVSGKDLKGVAELVVDDKEAVAGALLALHPRYSAERAAQRAQDRVLVRIKVA
jgi:deazaflavin-dependent oxidoreductase (nitroreductase family)